MRSWRLALALAAAPLATTPAEPAAQWPDFRGPTGQGISDAHALPVRWSETQNIAWKVPIPGRAWSSPVVEHGRVWLTTAVEDREETSLRLLAFDVTTGREVVNVEAFRLSKSRLLNPKNSHASPSPVVHNGRVFAHFGAAGTAAFTTDGAPMWKAQLRYASQHGSGGSPVAYGDLLIVSCDGHDTAFVAALDQATGRVRWRTARREPFDQAYTTPLVIRVRDRAQIVSVGAYRAAAYDPDNGREIWRVSYGDGFSNVPRPVFGHGLVYLATGFQQPALIAVRADGTGDVTRTHVAWRVTRGAPLTPSPLVVGDELYFVSDIGVASAVDAKTGTLLWQQRLGGNFSASPVAADGRIYFQSEEGVTTVIAAGREFRILATNRLDEATLASTAVADGSFFIRGDRHLYRVDAQR